MAKFEQKLALKRVHHGFESLGLFCSDELGFVRETSSSQAYESIVHRYEFGKEEEEKKKKDRTIVRLRSAWNEAMRATVLVAQRRNGAVEVVRCGGGFLSEIERFRVSNEDGFEQCGIDITQNGCAFVSCDSGGNVSVGRADEFGAWGMSSTTNANSADAKKTKKNGKNETRVDERLKQFKLDEFDAEKRAILSARTTRCGTKMVYGGQGQGNDVKICDVEHEGKIIWKAKPPPTNWLNYRAPPWVKCLRFKPTDESNTVFAVGTGEKKVRLYDARENKRAIMECQFGEAAVNSVAFSSVDEFRLFAGDSRGKCVAIDLKTGKSCGSIRGNSGSIREIEVHPTLDLVATAGLDRYVRVYDGTSRKCLGAAYAKQCLTSVAWDVYGGDGGDKQKKKKKSNDTDADDDDDDEDDEEGEKKLNKKKKKKTTKKEKKSKEDRIVKYVDFDSDDNDDDD